MQNEVLQQLVRQRIADRNARYENRRYLVRVITKSGLTAFVNPRMGDAAIVPAKKDAYRYVSLAQATRIRKRAASTHESAWVVIDYND